MAQEGCDDSTKADWASWAYHEYRRLLDEEMMAVCRTYAEGRPADLSVHEGREAQKWLTGAHGVVERAREHISMRLRHLAGAREIGAPLQTPRRVYSYQQQEKRRAKLMAYISAGGRDGHHVRRDRRRPAKRLYRPAYTRRNRGRPGGLDQRVRHLGPGGNAAAFQRS
jgi:hypothetical protein